MAHWKSRALRCRLGSCSLCEEDDEDTTGDDEDEEEGASASNEGSQNMADKKVAIVGAGPAGHYLRCRTSEEGYQGYYI